METQSYAQLSLSPARKRSGGEQEISLASMSDLRVAFLLPEMWHVMIATLSTIDDVSKPNFFELGMGIVFAMNVSA